jgi:hypothetical protein
MITDQASANQSKPGSGQEPTNVERRTLIGAGLAALLTAACSSPTENGAQRLSSSGLVTAAERDAGTVGGGSVPNDPFILLLKGLYQPVPKGSGQDNFGLTTVDLNDGSYSKTRIYPIFGIQGSTHQDKSIGTFYVSSGNGPCAYDLPGGAIAMQFLPGGKFPGVPFPPDGMGGQYDEGYIPLTILEATGIYRAFAGGHNHMVDKLHQLVAGPPFAATGPSAFPSSGYDELCFCMIFKPSDSFPV